MCFSATASFSASVALVPVAFYCLKYASRLQKAYWLFALIPLFFAIQQFFEGLVWLAFETGDGARAHLMALGFVFFSHLLWLIWIPLSCYAVESNALKRKFYLFLTALGTVHGLLLYVPLWLHQEWLTVKIVGHSIHYQATLLHDAFIPLLGMQILYALLVLVPLLTAGDRHIRLFGVFIVVSLALTSLYFNYALISVWCFFAAVLSIYILFMLLHKTREGEHKLHMDTGVDKAIK
jgi:hypothetical protein